MDLGVHLPMMVRRGNNALDSLNSFVKDADRLGFTDLAIGDHFLFGIDTPIALASVIGVSGKMRLVSSILLAVQRGLIPTAKMLAALDILSGGRMTAGLGPGSMEREYDLNGIDWQERWPRFDEMVSSLRALLHPDMPAFKGRFYSTEGFSVFPPPVQQPKLPIWIGSWGSDAGLRRVARLGDGWQASAFESTPQNFREALEKLAGYLDAQGKNPETFPNAVSTMFGFISRDQTKLDEMSSGGRFGERRPDGPGGGGRPPINLQGEGGGHLEHAEPPMIGTPEQWVERLSGFKEVGVQTIYLGIMSEDPDQLQTIAEEVMPHLR